MRHRTRGVVAAASLMIAVGACGDGGAFDQSTTTGAPASTTTSTAEGTTSTAPTTTVPAPTTSTSAPSPSAHAVYFLLAELDEDSAGPFLVPVYRELPDSDDPGLAVVEALLAGPTADEASGTPAISTAIPEGAQALGVDITDGRATVDLSQEFADGGGSASMFARLAQVVYTLTRLPDVDGVSFELEGEPVTVFSSEGIELDGPQSRDDYYDWLPAIFVDSPAWGEPVESPIEVTGLSNVFEAVHETMLTDDDGMPFFEGTVTASCGTGCWGDWSVDIPYEIDRDQFGSLIVWEISAGDASQTNVREYPIQLR